MQRLLMLGSALALTLSLSAQQFGGTPPSQKWKQIETDTARIIFPEGLDSTAQRMASIVHYMAAARPASLGNQLRRINIVLQHQTTIPNGYVGLGPFRSEFFLTPVSNNFREGSISWPDQLALHEYRHVQQYNNFRNGLSKAMYYLFGEEGLALAINAAIPDWFYEGDAVHQETILSKQGRGRLPLFLNAYPSLWQSDKNYSWMKLRNGSLKDYVPNHYELGYLLVNYGYATHGPEFWKKVSRDASSFRGLFYPFQQAIKKHAGEDYKTFRQKAFNWYKEQLSANSKIERTAQQSSSLLPVKKSYVNNYYFPYGIGADSILYLKSTYRHRPAFFIHGQNGEKRLRVRDISLDEQFSYRNGRVVYTAFEPHPRWGWKDYSVIKLLDIASGRQRNISRKSKYFTPDISFSGKRIAAVEIDPGGKTELHILDSDNGQLLQRIKSSDILVFTDPKFINEDSLVMAVRLRDGRMALALAEISTGNTMRLTPPSYNVVGYPFVDNGRVYFTASYQGNDDLYAIELSNQKIYKLRDGQMGKYFVNAGSGKLNWSEFTAEGYQLMQTPDNSNNWTEVDKAQLEQLNAKFSVSQPDKTGDILLQQVVPRYYTSKTYKKSTRLLNFHSWRPYYEDPVFTYSLYGENVLNTLQTELYYLYNQDERTSAVGFNTIFGGLFPYLQAGTEFTFDRQGIMANRVKRWNQLDTRAGFSLPLNFTSGRSYKFFNAGSYYVLRNEFNKGFFKDSIGNTTFSYLLHTISWSQQVERAVQHIFPRLGYTLSANHRHAISSYEGYQFIGNASLYLPGLFSNHSLMLNGSIQQRDTLRALFSTRFASARGYEDYYRTTAGSRLWRLSANYHLPLFIPDWGFANILYIQRIRANLFYDFQRLFSNNKKLTADLRSTGIELYADTKWWNQYPLTFGIRISRILDDDPLGRNARNSNLFEFILPVSIIPR